MGRKRVEITITRADEEPSVVDEINDICNSLRNRNVDLSNIRFTPMRNAVNDRWCREFESACRRLKRSRADLSRIGFISKLAKDGY